MQVRRISRDGRDHRLSPYVIALPESERPYRRIFAPSEGDLGAACGAPIAQVCPRPRPLTLTGWLVMVHRCLTVSWEMRAVHAPLKCVLEAT
jgi:hypothetical protein